MQTSDDGDDDALSFRFHCANRETLRAALAKTPSRGAASNKLRHQEYNNSIRIYMLYIDALSLHTIGAHLTVKTRCARARDIAKPFKLY